MSFKITDPCFVDHVYGLLPGRVLGRKVDGSALHVALDLNEIDEELRLELAGKRWYDAAHVLTPAEAESRHEFPDGVLEREFE